MAFKRRAVASFVTSCCFPFSKRSIKHPGYASSAVLVLTAALLTGCAPVSAPPQASKAPKQEITTIPEYSIHLLPGGKEMELTGGMTDGMTDAIRHMLDANPKIIMIHLNSPGGEPHEGYQLAVLIRERHLATYTSATCASACTLAYIAGSPRYLAQNAWLGFHSSSRSLGGQSWSLGNEGMRTIYKQGGLPDGFIDKALNTPPSDIWYPTHDELTSAHVVDSFVDRNKFAQSGNVTWKDDAEVDTALKADKFYSVLAASDSANYEKIREIFLKGAQDHQSVAEIEVTANNFVKKNLFPTYIRKAPDAALIKYQQSQMAELDYLAQNSPIACAATAMPELFSGSNDLAHSLPSALQRADLDALADLASGALTHPRDDSDSAQDHQALMTFVGDLSKTSPQLTTVMGSLKLHVNDPELVCNSFRDLYHALLDQPPEMAAAISRAILGNATS